MITSTISKEVLIMGNEKYTQKVIEAFQSAQQIAALHYNQELSSVHMLMGLTKEPEGLLNTIFSECHTDVPMLQARLEQLLKKIPSVKGSSQLSMSTEMVRVIGKAQQLADSMHDEYISTEHILMGIVSESDDEVQQLCREFGLTQDKIMSTIKANRKANVNSDNPEENYKALEKYGRDLTAAARQNKLDPVIGRETKSAAPSKFSRAAVRTTRSSSVNRVSARRLSSKAWPAVSSAATSRNR